MKNIALAIQMCLADYNDALFLLEHRREMRDFFNTFPGGSNTFGPWVEAGQDCGGSQWIIDCKDGIQGGCPDVWDCFLQWHTSPAMLKGQTLMKKGTRHLGGSSIGFLDGHASWWQAERSLDTWAEEAMDDRSMWPPFAMGMEGHWNAPVSWCSSSKSGGLPFSQAFPDEPTLR